MPATFVAASTSVLRRWRFPTASKNKSGATYELSASGRSQPDQQQLRGACYLGPGGAGRSAGSNLSVRRGRQSGPLQRKSRRAVGAIPEGGRSTRAVLRQLSALSNRRRSAAP